MNKEQGNFRAADRVEWTSQSNGRTKTKNGKVFAVIPPNFPIGLIPGCKYEGQLPRDHESYIVEVYANEKKGTGRKLYWPRVSSLELVEAA